jgi:ribosomal-protein-alanine N-acetyltransferase
MQAYYLRRMVENDLNSVLEIEHLSFPHPWRFSTFIGELENYPISIPFVIIHRPNDRLMGYIILWFIQEEVQISNFALHPDFRRMGVGEAVLRDILDKVTKEGASEIFLEVRPSNSAARSLYEKLGFQILGKRKNYYQSPNEDALIMGKNLA